MVRAVLTMVVREGCELAFEEAWKGSVLNGGEPPGSLGQAMMRDPEQRRMYIITGDWESREALKSFEKSSERIALSDALAPLRESATKAVLEIIARI